VSTRADTLNAAAQTEYARTLVIGASGLVGGYIVEHLVRRGIQPLALPRVTRQTTGVEWLDGNLKAADTLKLPPFETLYCTTDAGESAAPSF
jgi:hypothetical protein